jgi:hypothetical protein
MLCSRGSYEYRKKTIWGQSSLEIARSRLNKPDLLEWPYPLNADFIICEFKRLSGAEGIYGPLLDFCTRNGRDGLGLIEGKTFFPFAYDWRADNRSSSDSLARFIRQVINDKRLRFIAHSMGGIVTRLMLEKHKDLLARTDVLFQVASPIGGSAAAFAALNGKPEIPFLLRLSFCFDRKGKQDFHDTIRNIPSVYQLLPPSDQKVIRRISARGGFPGNGAACDLSLWSNRQAEHLTAAEEVHQLLASQLDLAIVCAYSKKYKTVTGYFWDEDSRKIMGATNDKFTADGDGTVTAESACRGTNPASCFPIEGGTNEELNHMGICRNPILFNLLKNRLFS